MLFTLWLGVKKNAIVLPVVLLPDPMGGFQEIDRHDSPFSSIPRSYFVFFWWTNHPIQVFWELRLCTLWLPLLHFWTATSTPQDTSYEETSLAHLILKYTLQIASPGIMTVDLIFFRMIPIWLPASRHLLTLCPWPLLPPPLAGPQQKKWFCHLLSLVPTLSSVCANIELFVKS